MTAVLQAKHSGQTLSMVVRDLLAMRSAGQREAVTAIIHMVRDKDHGRESRYALPLKGLPLWELKTRSRGGVKGGARVYFFWTSDGIPVLCGAEVKDGDSLNSGLLREALNALLNRREGDKR